LFDGKGAYFSFPDAGPNSPLDFSNGDSITLEAWVNPSGIAANEIVSVVGKGRTGTAGFSQDNQNWALRLREKGGAMCLNFLFATPKQTSQTTKDAHWHRWTSAEGFAVNSGWHHVAITYRFGEASSIKGWIDGRPMKGAWDMGGPTAEAPVVDDDAVWIGSTNKASAANSFRGMIDSIAIHREALDSEVLSKRYQRTGESVAAKLAPETMPDLGDLPQGKVQITFHQDFPSPARWLNEGEQWPKETLRWTTDRFLLPRLPTLYDTWGIRDAWKGPVLVRLAADVVLPAGDVELQLRVKNLGRVWLNGALVMRNDSHSGKSPPDGEEPLAPPPVSSVPGLRSPGYEMREVFGTAKVPEDGRCRVVVETLVGGPKWRAEPGELCLSFRSPNGGHLVLGAADGAMPLPLTDDSMEPELKRLANAIESLDTQNRRQAATTQDAFWNARHSAAKSWGQRNPAPTVPPDAAHPVDAFLKAKIRTALDASAKAPIEDSRHFHTKVLSILRDECFRCHGDKDKGGLKLNSREAALRPGESGIPALVPGDIAASQLIQRIRSKEEDERMPPKGQGLKPEQIEILENWIRSGAGWPSPPVSETDVKPSAKLSDAAYLRRLWLDLAGVPPSESALKRFSQDSRPNKRELEIDQLLEAPTWADSWMPYWMDVLAENPTLINPTLNTTGPFRWFILDALRDNKPFDRFVTELVLMRGNQHTGGSAGFSVAGENDAPFATKGQIIASAFLAVELQCARCHDAPYHSTKQADLFGLAALLERKPVTVPKTSMVPAAFFEKKTRESLIKATLKPGEQIQPGWAFADDTGAIDDQSLDTLTQNPKDTRERLAALLTSPQNTRFARVIVNRTWRRFIGAGFIEPVADWEGHSASHPDLMNWLAHDFVIHGYDLKHLVRRILTSELYQREATGSNLTASADLRFFTAPERRRLSAEQVVDALYSASGQPMNTEEITFDPTGRRPEGGRINLGKPTRAWMLANLTNDRDRPSLSLPYSQCVVDVLEAFGWSGARQAPRTDREIAPNVLQPGVLANGALSSTLTRASYNSPLADLAVRASSPESIVESVFLRFLSRPPTQREAQPFLDTLREGFTERLVPELSLQPPPVPEPLPRLTWFNHLHPDSTTVALQNDKRARQGPPPDPRLKPEWREKFEDLVWSVLNTREFVWMP
jgi:mono/diheme cytochrome c family protein